ncbi:MAG: hypothetical protein QM753_11470 [Thermomicrobiales bacterium]
MQKTFRITVEGRSYTVVVEDLTDAQPALPTAAGGEGVVTARPAPPPPPPPPAAATPSPAEAAPPGEGAVVAPLAGVIHGIDVRVGQTVNPGDQIAIIEAMKMKTYVVAKSGGTVTSIAVKVQDSVETGQLLATLG